MKFIGSIQFVYLLVLICTRIAGVAQENAAPVMSNDDGLQQNMELMAEQLQAESGDVSNLTEMMNYRLAHPLNLNHARVEDLRDLQLLTDMQINTLLKHRERNGPFLSAYELQSVEGFDVPLIRALWPYIRTDDSYDEVPFRLNDVFKNGSHAIITRVQRILERQAGYINPDSIQAVTKPNSYYLGDPNRALFRYRFTYRQNISVCISGDKDPGEEFFAGSQKQGFDFYSGHMALQNIGIVKSLVIGDFQATFGQGLTLWDGFAFGKSANLLSLKRYGMGIRPYASFDENRFLRGAAATIRFGQIEATALVSYKKIDANILPGDTSQQGINASDLATSLITGGLHNTRALIADKGRVTQWITGGNVAWQIRSFHLGITAQHLHMDVPLVKTPQLYNGFDFSGSENTNVGMDYNAVIRNVNLYGEASMSSNSGKALVQGLVAALDQRLTISAHYRYFSRDFQNLLANAISENTLPQNEQGIYLGLEAKLSSQLTYAMYLDRFRFDWLKYGVSAPSNGSDLFAQLSYTPSKTTGIYLRYRYRLQARNTDAGNYYTYTEPTPQYNYRFNVSTQISRSIRLKTRIEYTRVFDEAHQPDDGMILAQDLIVMPARSLSVCLRYAVFDTKSYASRVYAYENDVPYSFSVPALSGRGQRFCWMLNWDITKKTEVSFRVARTVYDHQTSIAEGSLNEITGNHSTEVKLQLRLRI